MSREDDSLSSLKRGEEECDAINVTSYNDVVSEFFVDVPFPPLNDMSHDGRLRDDGYIYCASSPDAEIYCTNDPGCEITAEFHAATVHQLGIDIVYSYADYIERNHGDFSEFEKNVSGWDQAAPSIIACEEDVIWDGIQTFRGTLTSIYRYENLQIVLRVNVLCAGEPGITSEGLGKFEEVNREVAEEIRDRAVERRALYGSLSSSY